MQLEHLIKGLYNYNSRYMKLFNNIINDILVRDKFKFYH